MPELLLEIGVEELPPASVLRLTETLGQRIQSGLENEHLLTKTSALTTFSSPRRMALRLAGVSIRQPDRSEEQLGPGVDVAFRDGEPTKAALGFARRCGVRVDQLAKVDSDKGPRLAYRRSIPGREAREVVPDVVDAAVQGLPVAKPMRWGEGAYSFVRPVHWIVALLDDEPLAVSLFGVESGTTSRGHRVHGQTEIPIAAPAEYESALQAGGVLVDPDERRREIVDQIESLTRDTPWEADVDDALLDEVTQLVEWPIALLGSFDEAFLEVPEEALTASLRGHQKCFPVRENGRLTHRFIAVANIDSPQPDVVRAGYERVVAPRLADARFFWLRDVAIPLERRRPALDDIVYQRSLGSLGDKTERVRRLAAWLAQRATDDDADLIDRAATLSRCDLLSETVGEFPELQGVAGKRIAQAQGHGDGLAHALEEFYRPRFSGDALPKTEAGAIVALADRLDTLVGIFAAGLKPKGSRDPYALRRAAVGAYRLLVDLGAPFDLSDALDAAVSTLPEGLPNAGNAVADVRQFIWDRARALLTGDGVSADLFDAVLAVQRDRPADFERRVAACSAFRDDPAAATLAAANKRIVNILRKADGPKDRSAAADLSQPAEQSLAAALDEIRSQVEAQVRDRRYAQALTALSRLRGPVDTFFDEVMVMSDDAQERATRLGLLADVRSLFLEVADISRLEIESS